MIWDILQHHRIRAMQGQIDSLHHFTPKQIKEMADYLDNKFGMLSLVCEAMWSLMKEEMRPFKIL